MRECCATCKNRLKLRKWDYTHGGCEHSDAEGFVCMACAYEGMAIWMVGVNPDTGMCEDYVRDEWKCVGSVNDVTVYGLSDDLVEIEGSRYPEDEIGCYESNVRIWFEDGTVILVGYSKEDLPGVWWIKVEKQGTAKQYLDVCECENADLYSDMFTISSEIVKHEVVNGE